ncbi:Protein of uncharacterised function (DUF3710) [Acidipropionibacterium jensenii]|uniref:Protein of uncharacterized function (DUF3710) n=1 Tax=Acidipropionibacterium jensenii TaxID=1749 RepID=A0A448NW70_9ACTN|nr:Protein of uncharacterised function (DUF3710) [Acidipropionibacterium jensenii]
MIFGRRKNKDKDVDKEAEVATEQVDAAETPEDTASTEDTPDSVAAETQEDSDAEDVAKTEDDETADGDTEEDGTDQDGDDGIYRINLEREDGPFDIDQVDLDADDIKRIDFGSLIVTPFEDMQMQIQIDQDSGEVQSLLVVRGNNALEVALFAAPSTGEMISQVHREMIQGTEAQNGQAVVNQGPLGAELHRVVPMTGPDGDQGFHVSRSWLTQGPRWLLRGVLMGDCAVGEELDATGQLLLEFFCNLVVRRDELPRVPGDVIPLKVPDELRAEES